MLVNARLDAVPARWVSQRMQQMTHREYARRSFFNYKIIRNEEFQASMEPNFLIVWMISRLQGRIYPRRQALGGHNKATTRLEVREPCFETCRGLDRKKPMREDDT